MTDRAEELVERVAKAMYDAAHARLSNCYAWDDQWEDYQEARREQYYRHARAAIAVMSTPWNGDMSAAPRDGTRIDLWVEFSAYRDEPACSRRFVNARWGDGEWQTGEGIGLSWLAGNPVATHWQHILPPPAEARRVETAPLDAQHESAAPQKDAPPEGNPNDPE